MKLKTEVNKKPSEQAHFEYTPSESAPENDWRILKNHELSQNIKERKRYARNLFVMLCTWLGLVLAILSISAIGKIPATLLTFFLSDAVLITLITTTTANIAAFFLVVTKHLFPPFKIDTTVLVP